MLNRGNTIATLFVIATLIAGSSSESVLAQNAGNQNAANTARQNTAQPTQGPQAQSLTPEQRKVVEQYKQYQQERYEQEARAQAQQQAQAQQALQQSGALQNQAQRNQQTQQGHPGGIQQHLTPAQREQLRIQQAANKGPQLPPEYANQSEAERKYISDMLDRWQASSEQVKRFTTKYTRWDYSPEFVNWRDPATQKLAAQSITVGEIRYQTPDKGMFESQGVWDFKAPPKKAGEQPEYKKREQDAGDASQEKWICDGKKIYEYEYQRKMLYETDIPVEMQGKGLVNSPIPFLFGADKADILNRFWVRVVTPKTAENELWLEAYPKKIADARNYKKLEIIISGEDFLPKGLHIYAPNYDAAKNPVSRYFAFEDRKVNDFITGIQSFTGSFVRPKLLMGWKRMDRKEIIAQEQQKLGAQQQTLPGAQQRTAANPNAGAAGVRNPQNGARK